VRGEHHDDHDRDDDQRADHPGERSVQQALHGNLLSRSVFVGDYDCGARAVRSTTSAVEGRARVGVLY
jgi:hypothetical protein